MAKIYATKRTQPAKYGKRRVTRYKKSYVTKSRRPQDKKLRSLVSSEVNRVLKSGVQNESRKVTISFDLSSHNDQYNEHYVGGKYKGFTCFRIPITDAIPAMSGSSQVPDVRRRGTNKLVVSAVNVRWSLCVTDETRVMMFPYEPHDRVREKLNAVPVALEPSAQDGNVPEKGRAQLVPYQMMGVISKHGPLMVRKSQRDILELDSVDGSPYECRLSTHAGKPIGKVSRKVFGRGRGSNRTTNWDQTGEDTGMGFIHGTNEIINEFWRMKQTYDYAHEAMNEPNSHRTMELFVCIDCPSTINLEGTQDIVGAKTRGLVLDIYYHDK